MIFGDDSITIALDETNNILEEFGDSIDKFNDSIGSAVSVILGSGGLVPAIKELSEAARGAIDPISKLAKEISGIKYTGSSEIKEASDKAIDRSADNIISKSKNKSSDKSSLNISSVKSSEFGSKLLKGLGGTALGITSGVAALGANVFQNPNQTVGQATGRYQTLGNILSPGVGGAIGKMYGNTQFAEAVYGAGASMNKNLTTDQLVSARATSSLIGDKQQQLNYTYGISSDETLNALTKSNYAGLSGESIESFNKGMLVLDNTFRKTSLTMNSLNDVAQKTGSPFSNMVGATTQLSDSVNFKMNPEQSLQAYTELGQQRGVQSAEGFASYETSNVLQKQITDAGTQSLTGKNYTDLLSEKPSEVLGDVKKTLGIDSDKEALEQLQVLRDQGVPGAAQLYDLAGPTDGGGSTQQMGNMKVNERRQEQSGTDSTLLTTQFEDLGKTLESVNKNFRDLDNKIKRINKKN